MTKTIIITSGKGGVGKTNISVNTALELVRRQHRTCLFDADLGLANVDILLGIHPEKTLDDFVLKGENLKDIIVTTDSGLDVIPGSSGVERMADLNPEQLHRLIEGFSDLSGYDYFLIDTSSGISRGVVSFCLASSETLLVLTAESTSLTDAYAVLKVLSVNDYGGTVRIIVNKCVSVAQAKKTYSHFKAVADKHLNIDVAPGGIVLHDPLIERSVSRQKPVVTLFPDSIASKCIRALVTNLVQKGEVTEEQSTLEAFWSGYFEIVQSNIVLPGEHRRNEKNLNKNQRHAVGEEVPSKKNDTSERANYSTEYRAPIRDDFQQKLPKSDTLWLQSPAQLLSSMLLNFDGNNLSIEEMKRIISSDPVLIGKALQLYHFSQRMQVKGSISLDQLVLELGNDSVTGLLHSAAVQGILAADPGKNFFEVNRLWANSYQCGLLAYSLARLAHYHCPDEALVAGMLHDIGKLAVQAESPGIYSDSFDLSGNEDSVLNTERETVGKNHAEVGAELLEYWGLGHVIADAARYHLDSEDRIATAMVITKIVNVAQRLISAKEDNLDAVVKSSELMLGLVPADVLSCLKTSQKKTVRTAQRYGIQLNACVGRTNVEEACYHIRNQVVNHLAIKGILPHTKCVPQRVDRIRTIHMGLNALFGIQRVICLLPNTEQKELCARGFPGCYGSEFLQFISFGLEFKTSQVVDAHCTGRIRVIKAAESTSVADTQLLSASGCSILICLPLVVQGLCRGVIVCGMDELEYSRLKASQNNLQHFAALAATYFSPSEEL